MGTKEKKATWGFPQHVSVPGRGREAAHVAGQGGWMDHGMPSSGCQQQAAPRGAHGQGTAEVLGALREAVVGPPPSPAAPTPWSTSLWSPWGADRGVQSTANSGEGDWPPVGQIHMSTHFSQGKISSTAMSPGWTALTCCCWHGHPHPNLQAWL